MFLEIIKVNAVWTIVEKDCVLCGFGSSPRGHDASQITLALGTAAAYPRACQALGAMLSKGALNPADITVLFKMFSSMDPPPVELVRGKLMVLLEYSLHFEMVLY